MHTSPPSTNRYKSFNFPRADAYFLVTGSLVQWHMLRFLLETLIVNHKVARPTKLPPELQP